jgi:hypothetical protein
MSKPGFDEDVSTLLRRIEHEATLPPDAVPRVVRGVARRSKRNVVVALTGIAALLLFAALGSVGVAGLLHGSDHNLAPASPDGDWQDLTGKAVGEALGLQPFDATDDHANCRGTTFTEYTEGLGFCYDPAELGLDAVEAGLLSWQIRGISRSPDLVEYVKLGIEEREIADREQNGEMSAGDSQRLIEVMERMATLRSALGIH